MKILLSVLLILLSCLPRSEAESLQSLVLEEDDFSTKAVIDVAECRASLERPKNQLNYVHFRNDCQQSLEKKLTLLKSMLEMLIPQSEDRHTIHTLFVGRLVLTFPEIAQRLAREAAESPEWDAKKAWKDSGYSNRFVLQLLKQEHLFPELQEALAEFDYKVQIASVEKF